MEQHTSWGKVAAWYSKYLADENSYHSKVVVPNLLRLMEIKQGEHVLDLACGTGFFSELFHAQGAQVIGVDIAAELITLAREHASREISFLVSNAHELKDIQSGSIDKIAIILAIQNIKEVKELFIECKRVLKKSGGKVYVVMNHPGFRIPGGSSWQWDDTAQKQYRRLDYYLSEKTVEIEMHPGSDKELKTLSFHRPLQFYIKHARSAEFAITKLEEWISHKTSEKGKRQAEEDRMRKEIPLFMFLELSRFKQV